MIVTFRGSSSLGETATSNKACCDSYRLLPIRASFLPHLPTTPPPDEPTTNQSVLTTPPPAETTDPNENIAIVVCASDGDHTVSEDTVEDAASSM